MITLLLLFHIVIAGEVRRSLVDLSDTIGETVKGMKGSFYYRPLGTAIPLAFLYHSAKGNAQRQAILATGATLAGAAYLAGSLMKSKPSISVTKVSNVAANHLLDHVDMDFSFKGAPPLVLPKLKVTKYKKSKYSGTKVKKTVIKGSSETTWGVLHYVLAVLTLMAMVLIGILLFK